MRVGRRPRSGTLKPVDTAAALASGSTTRPPLPQPWARVLPLLLGSGPSRFEATRQPSSGSYQGCGSAPHSAYRGLRRKASLGQPEGRGGVECSRLDRVRHGVPMPLCAAAPPAPPSTTTRACACTCTRVLFVCLHVCARMHSGWGERTNHARTDARACARDPPCAADAKNQCEAQMKYRMERKEMRRPHQAVLPRMPVMPTVRGTTNQPVDVL